jgi:CheY-like chemotaxis protein
MRSNGGGGQAALPTAPSQPKHKGVRGISPYVDSQFNTRQQLHSFYQPDNCQQGKTRGLAPTGVLTMKVRANSEVVTTLLLTPTGVISSQFNISEKYLKRKTIHLPRQHRQSSCLIVYRQFEKTVNIMQTSTITVLLVERHVVVREGIHLLLEAQPDIQVIGETGDGEDAVRLVEQLHPHVVVMDVGLSGLSSLQATCQICQNYPEVHVVILTAAEDGVALLHLLQAGAYGYLPKKVAGSELIHAIRAVCRGEAYIHPSILNTSQMLAYSS